MKSIFTAVAAVLAVALAAAVPARATTFPALTTIYYAVGVFDSGGGPGSGTATTVSCSNLSGQTASVRWLVTSEAGALVGSTTHTVPFRQSYSVSTHGVFLFADEGLTTGAILQGGIITVRSTQSAVFCTAMIVDAAAPTISGIDLHMVRFNAHPGTVE